MKSCSTAVLQCSLNSTTITISDIPLPTWDSATLQTRNVAHRLLLTYQRCTHNESKVRQWCSAALNQLQPPPTTPQGRRTSSERAANENSEDSSLSSQDPSQSPGSQGAPHSFAGQALLGGTWARHTFSVRCMQRNCRATLREMVMRPYCLDCIECVEITWKLSSQMMCIRSW